MSGRVPGSRNLYLTKVDANPHPPAVGMPGPPRDHQLIFRHRVIDSTPVPDGQDRAWKLETSLTSTSSILIFWSAPVRFLGYFRSLIYLHAFFFREKAQEQTGSDETGEISSRSTEEDGATISICSDAALHIVCAVIRLPRY